MATLGTIESFNLSIEDWNAYSERFEQYVITNDIKDEKKIVETFLTTIGGKTYNVLRDWLAPAKPSEVKFEELVKTLRDHYEPKPIVTAERFHFHKREQNEGEGVAAYSADLKKCSEHCAFGTFIEEALRDRFASVSLLLVCPQVGYALLVVPVLSLHQVVPLASLHLPWFLAGQVLHWVESPFLGSHGLKLPVVHFLTLFWFISSVDYCIC